MCQEVFRRTQSKHESMSLMTNHSSKMSCTKNLLISFIQGQSRQPTQEKLAERVRILGRQTFATKVRLSCVLSLKFGGKSQKNGGDISPASPAFRMYVFKPNISGPRMPKVILLETNSKGDYFVHQSWLIVVLWAILATQGNASLIFAIYITSQVVLYSEEFTSIFFVKSSQKIFSKNERLVCNHLQPT